MNQIAIMESMLEVLGKQVDDLKCCGNCGIIASILCPKYYVGIVAENYDYWKHCYNWQSDALTRKDREK